MSTKDLLYMETTQISPGKTALEIQEALMRAGARQVAADYDDGKVVGLRWVMRLSDGSEHVFSMPARVEPVFQILRKRATWRSDNAELRAKAERVAWRQLLRWVQAQLALVRTGMVTSQEVFLPYLHVADGRTLYQALTESRFKLLAAPAGE